MALQLVATAALSLTPGAPTKLHSSGLASAGRPQLAPLSVLSRAPHEWAAPAARLAATLPAAAMAEDGGFDIVNLILTGIIGSFVLFIGSFAFEAVSEVGTQAGKIAEYDRKNPRAKSKQAKVVYDDTGGGAFFNNKSEEQQAAQLRKDLEMRKKKGAASKQVKADGSKFAPWMNIDEERVNKIRAERTAERNAKKKAGAKQAKEPEGWNPFQ